MPPSASAECSPPHPLWKGSLPPGPACLTSSWAGKAPGCYQTAAFFFSLFFFSPEEKASQFYGILALTGECQENALESSLFTSINL